MKLSNIRAEKSPRTGELELIVELDGVYYEAVRFPPNYDAVDLARKLQALAAQILHRCER